VNRAVRRALGGLSAALVTGVLVLPATPSSAAPAKSCPKLTVKQDVSRADAVLRGVVKSVSSVHGSGKQRTRNYRVAADRVYEGSLITKSVVVTARTSSGGCGLLVGTLAKGKRYIFFVTERGTQLMAASATARARHPLTHQIVKLLGNGKHPQAPPPANAQFTKVADANPPRLSRMLAPGGALVILSLLGLLVVGRLGRRTT
jgi:hypothetical protein